MPKPYFKLYPLTSALLLLLMACLSCQRSANDSMERSLGNAIQTFELEDGFQIELIAGEPLISDPVDMEIDEFGRMYVVEMHGYPLDLSGSGKIKLLSDTNGDGKMDQSTVFAENLVLPTGILRWKNGLLVTDPPHVYYLEDRDGDGKADIKEIVLTGFAVSNPQHNVNSPRLGLDNWIYLGHEPAVSTNTFQDLLGDRGSEVHFPSNHEVVRLPQNAGGRSVRFRPDSFELEVLASRTQFGHTFDKWGHRFVINNNNHIIQDVIPARYLNRNPYLLVSQSTESISDHGNAAEVFPITKNPEHQLLTDLGVMTSACGITAYLGGSFSSEYDKAVFIAEPVSNILHIDLLSDNGTLFKASRQHPEKEFLASTDSWFRPVNMYIGPDGALYLLDYYRQYIEHPEWMAEDVVNSGALYNGTDKGRIYRITPKGTKPLDWSNKLKLGDFTDQELVEKLADSNIWWRRNAQRLLVDRKISEIPKELFEMASNIQKPEGRVHALWTLEGLGKTNPELIIPAFQDKEAGVRKNAIQIAELHLSKYPEMETALLQMVSDSYPKVRFQLLCTLGFLKSEAASKAREKLLFENIEDEWMQVAALSAPFEDNKTLMQASLANYDINIPAYGTLVQRLSAMTAYSLDKDAILDLISKGTNTNSVHESHWQAPLLNGLAQGLQSKNIDRSTFRPAENMLLTACFENPSLQVRQASLELLKALGVTESPQSKILKEKAKAIAANKGLSEQERVIGINFLSLFNSEDNKTFFESLLKPIEPNEVQLVALKAISRIPDTSAAELVVELWPSFTPVIREEGLNIFMVNNDRISILLDAMENGIIQPNNLGWPRSVRLMNNSNIPLRTRARLLINSEEKSNEEILQQYQASLTLNGTQLKGQTVYQENCAICHKMGQDLGMAFGPDLATMKNRRPENILSDILLPNLSIADGYDLWSVEMQNGENLQGLIASETPTAILLRFAGGQERSVARQDIRSLTVMDISAMPSLESNINPQEMADLLAFILKIN
ncbi:PVC-type heme-binding CxxCH protein [Aquiflexum lacus]|uniref:PVC-type heme-binding CxxCH protein n=1 Tax=Aquiflexum lacus TaxID=2483805 RepID=UPI001E330F21|nr:PVC-type heme-binding CxxCH protein [Aquiflexum lacus]